MQDRHASADLFIGSTDLSWEVFSGFLESSIREGIIAVAPTGMIIFSNRYAVNQIRLLPNRHIKTVLPKLWPHIEKVQIHQYCLYGITVLKNKRIFIVKLNPIVKGGNSLGVICLFDDYVNNLESSRQLRAYHRLAAESETIFNNSHDGLWIQDGKGKVLAMNPAAERLSNLRAKDCIGKNIRDIITQNFVGPSITMEAAEKGTTVMSIFKCRIKTR